MRADDFDGGFPGIGAESDPARKTVQGYRTRTMRRGEARLEFTGLPSNHRGIWAGSITSARPAASALGVADRSIPSLKPDVSKSPTGPWRLTLRSANGPNRGLRWKD